MKSRNLAGEESSLRTGPLSEKCRVLDLTNVGLNDEILGKIFEICGKYLEILFLNWNDKITDLPFYNLVNENSYPQNVGCLPLKKLDLRGCNKLIATHGNNPWLTKNTLINVFKKLNHVTNGPSSCDFVEVKRDSLERDSLEILDHYNDTIEIHTIESICVWNSMWDGIWNSMWDGIL